MPAKSSNSGILEMVVQQFPFESRHQALLYAAEAAAKTQDPVYIREAIRLVQQQLDMAGRDSKGLWMTAKEISEHGGFCEVSILKKLGTQWESREREKKPGQMGKIPREFYIALENCRIVDKTGGISQLLKLQASPEAEEMRQASTGLRTLLAEIEPPLSPENIEIRMTAAEIKSYGSPMNSTYIGQVLRHNYRTFNTGKRGRAHEGTITLQNCHRIGLSPNKIREIAKGLKEKAEFQITREQSKPRLDLEQKSSAPDLQIPELSPRPQKTRIRFANGNTYEIDSTQLYQDPFFYQVLSNLGSQFRDRQVQELFKKVAASGSPLKRGVPGNTIVGLIKTASQAAFIGDELVFYLSAEAGVNPADVREFLNRNTMKKHFLAGDLFPYIPRFDLETLAGDIRESVFGVREFPEDITVTEQPKLQLQAKPADAEKPKAESLEPPADKFQEKKKRQAREASKVSVEAGGFKGIIYSGDKYTSEQAGLIISQIHPGFFRERAGTVVQHLACDGYIPGASLIEFLNQFTGGILDPSSSSAQQTIERETGLSFSQIVQDPRLNRYIYTLPGEFAQYMRKQDLIRIRKEIDSERTGHTSQEQPISTRAPATAIQQEPQTQPEQNCRVILQRELQTRLGRAAPNQKLLEKLIATGVLLTDSAEEARRTASDFARAMNGYAYFQADAVREQLGVDWPEFKSRYIPELVNQGVIKDAVQDLGRFEADKEFHCYLVRKGVHLSQILAIFGRGYTPYRGHDLKF
ncbi:hypothetical protein FJZ19_04590 [Candidatus Pacearchaeota archaeon]|nr:hypothetical protein [Candidatus Pacearchaeota archaeon]